jgi:hypothetical protein
MNDLKWGDTIYVIDGREEVRFVGYSTHPACENPKALIVYERRHGGTGVMQTKYLTKKLDLVLAENLSEGDVLRITREGFSYSYSKLLGPQLYTLTCDDDLHVDELMCDLESVVLSWTVDDEVLSIVVGYDDLDELGFEVINGRF